MKCRVCKKEFLEDELTEGYCDECFEKSSDEKEKNMPNSKHIYGYYNDIANKFKLLKWVVLTLGIILTMGIAIYNYIMLNVAFPSICIAFLYLIGVCVFTFILDAIAEIIQLLQEIKDKQ